MEGIDSSAPESSSVIRMDEEQAKPSGRPIWSGIVSLGLVNVPVRLYTMIRERTVSFKYLRRSDGCPLRYDRVCTHDNKVVAWADVAQGYEVRRGEYVVFTKEELAALRPESDRKVRVDKFVHYLSVDPIHFDASYILAPDKSEEAYGLLLTAFDRKGMAGVGRFTLRTRESPCLIHAYRGALVLTTLRYASEVADPASVKELQGLEEPKPSELAAAEKIIDNLTGDFDIDEYRDTYSECVRQLIGRKTKGETIVAEQPRAEEARELMSALQETLRQLEKK